MPAPIVIGGSGHSGTRIFAQILDVNGVSMGIPRLTRHSHSYDLMQINLLSKWLIPYVRGTLGEAARARMQREFRRRLRLCFPLRTGPWGFKNPRTMLLLRFFHELFPEMRFIHVVRDGRDMSFGNTFADPDNPHPALFLSEDEDRLSMGERMMLYWGRSNLAAREYGQNELKERYLMIRFEDLCDDPQRWTSEILRFAGRPLDRLAETQVLVRRPKSIGRWRGFDGDHVRRAIEHGQPYLEKFGYDS
jgi:hypothetical protein